MKLLGRLHIWIGWLVGIPLLIWTISGLVMVSRPIEEVRGNHLRAAPQSVSAQAIALPQLANSNLASLNLVTQQKRSIWVAEDISGKRSRYDAQSGALMDDVSANEARILAEERFSGDADFAKITYFAADNPPIDLRRNRPSWQAIFADDTRIYIDAQTGEMLAIRTQFWRVFDFMWGLHIMDLQTRDDTSHPLLIGFAALAALSVLIGLILLFRRRKKQKARAA